MAKQLFANNVRGKLNAGINNVQTSMTLQAGQGALVPTVLPANGDWLMLTLIDASGNIEIVKVTDHAAASDTIGAMTRAQEGTTSRTFQANDKVELRWTKGSIEYFRDNLFAPSGTRMTFQQTAAPTFWTKEAGAAYNDAALRFTTGAVATGGADAFSSHFGAGKSSAATTLTTAHLPASGLSIPSLSVSGTVQNHTHGQVTADPGASSGGDQAYVLLTTSLADLADQLMPYRTRPGGPQIFTDGTAPSLSGSTGTGTTGNMGSGTGHSHALSAFDMKFADCIIAAKD